MLFTKNNGKIVQQFCWVRQRISQTRTALRPEECSAGNVGENIEIRWRFVCCATEEGCGGDGEVFVRICTAIQTKAESECSENDMLGDGTTFYMGVPRSYCGIVGRSHAIVCVSTYELFLLLSLNQ